MPELDKSDFSDPSAKLTKWSPLLKGTTDLQSVSLNEQGGLKLVFENMDCAIRVTQRTVAPHPALSSSTLRGPKGNLCETTIAQENIEKFLTDTLKIPEDNIKECLESIKSNKPSKPKFKH